MAEAPITVHFTVQADPSVAGHPLATRDGIVAIAQFLEADRVWSKMTTRQRELVTDLCGPLAGPIRAGQRTPIDGLPALPGDVRSSTRGSMVNAGLVDELSGRLTFKAVHAWFYKVERGSGGAS